MEIRMSLSLMSNRFYRYAQVAACVVGGLTLGACAEQGPPGHVQGHMENALSYLNEANDQLSQASHDKGGHRVEAINLVNQAISEVHTGIDFANNHGG